jgi:hypothetical protein
VSHTPEKWYTLERKGRISHDYGKTIIPASQIVLTDENLARADLCVNALAGVADPAAEIERLRQIEKQWHEDQMRARADSKATKAVLEAAGLEVLGWSVNCPPGHEHDTLLFGDGDDAHEQAELFNSDCPEGESPHVAVPLYAIDPAQVARWKADAERYRALRNIMYTEGVLSIGEADIRFKSIGACPEPHEWDTVIDAIAAKGGE